MKPKWLIFQKKLVHPALEASLKEAAAFDGTRWAEEAREHGLFVDLSRIEWVDLSAAARLILFVEAALRDGIKVKVAMPVPLPLPGDNNEPQDFKSPPVTRRKEAIRFLEFIEFEQALRCEHLHNADEPLSILIDNGLKQQNDGGRSVAHHDMPMGQFQPSTKNIPRQYDNKEFKHLFPLRWVAKHDDEQLDKALETLMNFIAGIMKERKRGISALDSVALANVILYELIDNVRRYAKTSHCLLAAWCRDPIKSLYADELDIEEIHFYKEWVLRNQLPLLELAIGDSGIGITNILGPTFDQKPYDREGVPIEAKTREEQILFWSLGRWSSSVNTSTDRGTRGLHRVHRLVKGYRGLITLRCDKINVGWDHGGLDFKRALSSHGLVSVPGTFISIRLPSLAKRIGTDQIYSRDATPSDTDFVLGPPINLEGRRPGRSPILTELEKKCLRFKLANSPTKRHRCVICTIHEIPDNTSERKAIVEQVLVELSKIANPGALVVAIPSLSPKELDGYVSSANEGIHQQIANIGLKKEHHDLANPILVLSRELVPSWVGVTDIEGKLLCELYRREGARATQQDLAGLDYNDAIIHLRQHDDLLCQPKLGEIALRFTVQAVFRFLCDEAAKALKKELDNPKQPGVEHNGPFRTPSLAIVRKWVDVNKYLRAFPSINLDANTLSIAMGVSPDKPDTQLNILTSSTFNNCADLQKQLEHLIRPSQAAKHEDSVAASISAFPCVEMMIWALAAC